MRFPPTEALTRTRLVGAALALALGAAACDQPEETEPYLTALSPRDQLIRLSVDLRGVHPSPAEITAIEADPGLYGDFVERYLDDGRFDARLRELYNLQFLTRAGDTYFDLEEAGLEDVGAPAVADALAEEPLRLISRIYAEDLPISELVTADYTMANNVTARMWDVELLDGGDGWQRGHYRDGRPHAGVLTMTTIWQRYPSMGGNANRHRANAISRLLLCDDYLSRPIVLNRAAVDQLTVDPETAISTNVGCQSCHSTLDPLAAHLFGFFSYDEPDSLRDSVTYRPENEEAWRDYSGKEPAYYGRPTANLTELAQEIADDRRFVECQASVIFEGLTQREIADEDWTELSDHLAVFEKNDLRLRPLIRSIVLSDEYRAAATSDPELAERLATVKTVSPAQLAAIIENLTGYTWEFDGREGLLEPDGGLAVLAGGVDGAYVSVPTYKPSVGMVFVQERLAQAAAWTVANADLDPDRTADARLLAYVTIEDTPESAPEAFDAQIRALYERITGEPLADDATEPDALVAVWKELYSVDASPTAAWAGVISAVLRDPRILFY